MLVLRLSMRCPFIWMCRSAERAISITTAMSGKVPVMELEDGLLPTIGKTRKTGTKVNFLPDDTIFEKTRFRAEEVKSRMHETAYLNPELTIIFDDRRGSETGAYRIS